MTHSLRRIGATLGAAAIVTVGIGGAAMADTGDGGQVGSGTVTATVDLERIPGELSMTVDGSTPVAFSQMDPGNSWSSQEFEISLSPITVTDTRVADEIPDGAAWRVIASASGLVNAETGESPAGYGLSIGPSNWPKEDATDITTSPATILSVPSSQERAATPESGSSRSDLSPRIFLTVPNPSIATDGAYATALTFTLME